MAKIIIEVADDVTSNPGENPGTSPRQFARVSNVLRRLFPQRELGRLLRNASSRPLTDEEGLLLHLLYDETGRLVPIEPAGATGPPKRRETTFSAETAETHYQALGAWKGPTATAEIRRAGQEFWRKAGKTGIRWLIKRLRSEHQIDRLHGVASLLAELGSPCLGPAFAGLAADPTTDQALSLLWAISSLAESDPTLRIDRARQELTLVGLLQHPEPDLREAAAPAMRLLGPERAARWLGQRLRDESDDHVRRTVGEELERLRAGRV